jgi:uncharacterized RDD family membrane protein YckC
MSTVKTRLIRRAVAKWVDLLVIFFLAIIFRYPIGPLLGFFYSLLADGAPFKKCQGQSLGKKLMNLRVIRLVDRQPARWQDSALRNMPIGVATFFGIIPVWGWLILLFIGIPLMIMELYLMLTAASGHRLGDVMADTEVIGLDPYKT